MKILILVARDSRHPRAAGGDRHITFLALELAREGHDVTMWVASDPSLPRNEEIGGVRVERLAPPRLLAPVVWARLASRGPDGFDLVVEEVVGGERTPFLAGVFARRVPHVGFWYQDNRPLFRDHYGRVGRRVAAALQAVLIRGYRGGFLLTPSQGSREWLVSLGFPPAHVAVFYVRADPNGLADPSRPFEGRRNRVVSIGNFRPLKRFEEAIETLAAVTESVSDSELVLIGRPENPEYLERLHSLAAARGLTPRVRFATGVDEPEKYRLLADSKVLTIHSQIEGFALTICEAGLCGVPAVVNPGVPSDTFADGVNGVQVPFHDIAAYARACTRLLTEETVWNELSQGAREMARPFTRSALGESVRALLETALAAKTRS